MDVDNFKKRNDLLGHSRVDLALQVVGKVLSECAKVEDLGTRLGGEEFALLLPNTDAQGRSAMAERVQQRLKKEITDPFLSK